MRGPQALTGNDIRPAPLGIARLLGRCLAAADNPYLGTEDVRNSRDRLQLGVDIGAEEPAKTGRRLADCTSQLSLRHPGLLTQLVELADNRVDLDDLPALVLELSPELQVFLEPSGSSPAVIGRIEQISAQPPRPQRRSGCRS